MNFLSMRSRGAEAGAALRRTVRESGFFVIAIVASFVLAAGLLYARTPATLTWLLSVRPTVLLAIVLALSVVAVTGAQTFIHRTLSTNDFIRHNEVGGFIMSVAGALYAVVLGFMTVAAWQHLSDARLLVSQEAAASVDAWHTALGLPPASRERVQKAVLDYDTTMFAVEWPKMRNDLSDVQGDAILMSAINAAMSFVPADGRQSNAQAATMQQLGILHDMRQRRLSGNAGGISWFEWSVLILGAICVIAFCWLFGLANPRVHVLMMLTPVGN